jgi:hypothetical protein
MLPLVVSYGMGVDSTAVLVELHRRGIRPDLILFADTGSESAKTYAFRPLIDAWLERAGFPPVTVVRYVPQDFKHWPPYHTLEENCLTNSTLPSLAFGFKSCSQKWKIAPQDKFVSTWEPARAAWASGLKVRKVIGYDAGPADIRRRNHAGSLQDPKYDYWYPLIEWGWDRERCKREIAVAGLPVPPKSSCYFCPAMKPRELHELTLDELKRIVVIEARAKPRLRDIDGLWRKPVKGHRGATPRPGSMTEYIHTAGLLAPEEIARLIAETPTQALSAEDVAAWQPWLRGILNGPELLARAA